MVLLADKLAPDIINNHLMRRVFSVGALMGLEMRALFKRVGPDGVARAYSEWPDEFEGLSVDSDTEFMRSNYTLPTSQNNSPSCLQRPVR